MLVSGGVSWDLNWLLQWIFSAFVVAVGLHTLVKNTASKYFEVDANFDSDHHHRNPMPTAATALVDDPLCAVCGEHGRKKCSRCKSVRYCSQACQEKHWKSEHKAKCRVFQSSSSSTSLVNLAQTGPANRGVKASAVVNKCTSSIALIPSGGRSKPIKQPKNALFPYDEFLKLFNRDMPGFLPCGLLNCGNSCFANVVLQCLSFTRPLIAYLLEKGHRRECCRNDWCFLCEFELHVEKTRQSLQAFSPMNILSRLPNIGGTLGYGRQEDAHEFMRFAIDTMQSVCLDEYGGEKAVPPNFQETTLIQHIFGGHLQSEVICTQCEKNSNQYENMMDLTVEIHGGATSLEECLDQFTAKEWLHGENMYKCDGCNDYVKAWKRLTVKQAPNILTIALKRFQSGRFGKLNKRVTFPETLNLSHFMSDVGDESDIYKLYAVVVHIDMLNASFFGHYICYIKDFRDEWYRIDDWKVSQVELEEVLSQGAYMLLYSRVSPRPSPLQTIKSSETEVQTVEVEVEPGPSEQVECLSYMDTITCNGGVDAFPCNSSPQLKVFGSEYDESLTEMKSGAEREHSKDMDLIDVAIEPSCNNTVSPSVKDPGDTDMSRSDTDMAKSGCSSALSNGFSHLNESSVTMDYEESRQDSPHGDVCKCKSETAHGNGYASANKYTISVEDGSGTVFSGISSFSTETSGAEMHQLKRRLPFYSSESDQGNGVKKVEISGG